MEDIWLASALWMGFDLVTALLSLWSGSTAIEKAAFVRCS